MSSLSEQEKGMLSNVLKDETLDSRRGGTIRLRGSSKKNGSRLQVPTFGHNKGGFPTKYATSKLDYVRHPLARCSVGR